MSGGLCVQGVCIWGVCVRGEGGYVSVWRYVSRVMCPRGYVSYGVSVQAGICPGVYVQGVHVFFVLSPYIV